MGQEAWDLMVVFHNGTKLAMLPMQLSRSLSLSKLWMCTGYGYTVGKGFDKGFPGGSVMKNPPANVGDMSSILTGISHIPLEQLSLCAPTTEAHKP